MFYDNNFKKSIVMMHQEYIKNKQPIKTFIDLIKKIFNISRSTFYDWQNNKEIVNLEIKKNYKNNNVMPIAEQMILLNKDKKIKQIKMELKKINISLNSKTIKYILTNNKDKTIKEEEIIKNKNVFIELTNEH